MGTLVSSYRQNWHVWEKRSDAHCPSSAARLHVRPCNSASACMRYTFSRLCSLCMHMQSARYLFCLHLGGQVALTSRACSK